MMAAEGRPESDPMPTEIRDGVFPAAGFEVNYLNLDDVYESLNGGSNSRQHSKYFSERYRLRTFVKWPNTFPVSPHILAQLGYIYIGPRDRVLCVFCHVAVDNIRSHSVLRMYCQQKRSVNEQNRCPFVLSNLPLTNDERQSLDTSISTYINDREGLLPKFPAMADVNSRLDTFELWPSDLIQRPHALAKAGFFYAYQNGKHDRVKCFMCGVVVYRWEPTDTCEGEHKRLRPECDFVIFNQDAVQAVYTGLEKEYTIRQLIDAYKNLRMKCEPGHQISAQELIKFLIGEDTGL